MNEKIVFIGDTHGRSQSGRNRAFREMYRKRGLYHKAQEEKGNRTRIFNI